MPKYKWVTIQRCYHGEENGKLGVTAGKHNGYKLIDGHVTAIGHIRLPRPMSENDALDYATDDNWRVPRALFPDLPEWEAIKNQEKVE